MTDPFKEEASSRRREIVFGLVALLGLVGLILFIEHHRRLGAGPIAHGRIVAVGTWATADGEKPLVTVQLEDGSTRQIPSNHRELLGCKVGSRVRAQLGRIVRLAPEGCRLQ